MFWRAYAILAHVGDRMGLRIEPRRRPPRPARNAGQILRALDQLDESVWTASALAAAVDSGLLAALSQPRDVPELAASARMPQEITAGLLDLLIAIGMVSRSGDRYQLAPGLRAAIETNGPGWLKGSLAAARLQTEHFRGRAAAGSLDLSGWRHTDPAVIEAQGEVTGGMAQDALPRLAFLPGLLPALKQPGAALLDVGAGAAGLSIALCRSFTSLSAVALEPAVAAAAVGDAKIAEAGLSDRIELRREWVENLGDHGRFDLAFLPEMFLSASAFDAALPRLYAALKPGGWLLTATVSRPGGDRASAIGRLKSLLWGGNARSDALVRGRLAEAGFDPVIRSPGNAAIRIVCARRPRKGPGVGPGSGVQA